jgi:hypothetical protein
MLRGMTYPERFTYTTTPKVERTLRVNATSEAVLEPDNMFSLWPREGHGSFSIEIIMVDDCSVCEIDPIPSVFLEFRSMFLNIQLGLREL